MLMVDRGQITAGAPSDAGEQSSQAFVTDSLDPLLTLDGAGRLLSANPAAERLLGRSAAALRGRRLLLAGVIARGSRRPALALARSLARTGSAPPVELRLQPGTGGAVVVRLHACLVRHADRSVEVEIFLRDLDRPLADTPDADRRFAAAQREFLRQEDERRRLAQRLHNELAQPMAALGLYLSGLRARLPDPADIGGAADEMQHLLTDMFASLQDLMRTLGPSVLHDFGLAAAVRAEGDDLTARTGLRCVVEATPGAAQWRDERAPATFRIIQDALADAAARAARQVRVRLERRRGRLEIGIRDDGAAPAPAPVSYDRTHLLGGQLTLASQRAGRVEVRIAIPDHHN